MKFQNTNSSSPTSSPPFTNISSVIGNYRVQNGKIVRKHTRTNTHSDTLKQSRSANSSLQKMSISRSKQQQNNKIINLQFTKKSPRFTQRTKRAQSNMPFNMVIEQQEATSDFSNSLKHISKEVIEIPFANAVIKPRQESKENVKVTSLHSRKSSYQNLSKERLNVLQSVPFRLSFQSSDRTRRQHSKSRQTSLVKQQQKPKENETKNTKQNQFEQLNFSQFSLKPLKVTSSHSIVYLGLHIRTGMVFAIKSIKKSQIKNNLESFLKRLKISLLYPHPNIATIYGFFSDHDNFFMVSQFLQQKMEKMNIEMPLFNVNSQQTYIIVNQILQAAIHLKKVAQGYSFSQTNVASSYGICKVTSFKPCSNDFQLRKLLQHITNRNSNKNLSKSQQSFTQCLQSVSLSSSSCMSLLMQHPYLRQHRFKALMRD